MKNFEPVPQLSEDSDYDDYLKTFWLEYGFSGNPPKSNTEAERRLKSKCEAYARFVIDSKKAGSYSDQTRRQLHNEIAVMVVGKQRSGMETREAKSIANFALAYTQGFTIDELESGAFDDVLYK